MDIPQLTRILESLKSGNMSVDDAVLALREEPFSDLGYAKVDHHRGIRQGVAEVIFGQNKTADQIIGIARNIREHSDCHVMITRIAQDASEALLENLEGLSWDPVSRIAVWRGRDVEPLGKGVVVATGGTSDIPVAEEAALTAELLGNRVKRIYDVGVAGLHRTLAHLDDFMQAGVVIAIAGMEGALASVIGGLCSCPVIAVPTSVGYGANFGGLSALLSMLNSCASGVAVVNIDNGFGAGYMASLINRGSES